MQLQKCNCNSQSIFETINQERRQMKVTCQAGQWAPSDARGNAALIFQFWQHRASWIKLSAHNCWLYHPEVLELEYIQLMISL